MEKKRSADRHKPRSQYMKEYRTRNRKKIAADRKTYHLKTTYGLMPGQYDEMVVAQQNRCAICGRIRSLCVDHNHETGQIRALLCSNCNAALGLLDDDEQLIKQAAAYVRKHRVGSRRRKSNLAGSL